MMSGIARMFFDYVVKGKYQNNNREEKINKILDEKKDRYDKTYMRMALEWAKLSHCNRAKVGSLIVKDGMIISDGFNGTPTGFKNVCEDDNNDSHWYVIHSEANAILKCAKNGSSCKGATIYLTHSPCKDCAKMIYQSGIQRIVYNKKYRDNDGIDFLEKSGLEINFLNNNLD
jgi:dCMP deaminase